MNVNNDAIFVQIPAYRDTQLVDTIESLLENAYNQDRLHLAVCWQHAKGERLPRTITTRKNIRIISIDYQESKGSCWARSLIQANWNKEPFTLSTDSHVRFAKHWDKKLLGMMRYLKNNNVAKPIISALPPSFFDPATFPKERESYPMKTYAKKHEQNLLIRFYYAPIHLYKWLKGPIPAQFIAMGFLFAEGSFNSEIPFDPHIYFFGDDITTGLRAYCHGYDFYHPHRPVAWHLYERKTRTPHWDDHKNWGDLNAASYKRVEAILKGQSFLGYPLGNVRTIQDYETYIGNKLIEVEPG